MTDVDIAKLTREFPSHALKQRIVGGGKALPYVEGHTIIHRLNEATGNCWDFTILNIDSLDVAPEVRLVTATVALTLPGLGTRQHIGVQTVNARGGEDLVKGAVTDALKKAATLFGVGLELYGPDYEAGEAAAPPQRATAAPADAATLNPATPKQRNYIKGLIKEAGWVTEGEDGRPHTDEMRLDRFLLKHYGATLGELSQEAAQRLIDNLLDGKKKREVAQGEVAHLTATANRTAAALAGMPAPAGVAGDDQHTG